MSIAEEATGDSNPDLRESDEEEVRHCKFNCNELFIASLCFPHFCDNIL